MDAQDFSFSNLVKSFLVDWKVWVYSIMQILRMVSREDSILTSLRLFSPFREIPLGIISWLSTVKPKVFTQRICLKDYPSDFTHSFNHTFPNQSAWYSSRKGRISLSNLFFELLSKFLSSSQSINQSDENISCLLKKEILCGEKREEKFSHFYTLQNMLPKKGHHFLSTGSSQLRKKAKIN